MISRYFSTLCRVGCAASLEVTGVSGGVGCGGLSVGRLSDSSDSLTLAKFPCMRWKTLSAKVVEQVWRCVRGGGGEKKLVATGLGQMAGRGATSVCLWPAVVLVAVEDKPQLTGALGSRSVGVSGLAAARNRAMMEAADKGVVCRLGSSMLA